MYTFGLNSSGQLGQGNTNNQITPRVVEAVTGIATIFAGWDQSFCIEMQTRHPVVSYVS